MLDRITVLHFSPTGGTRRAALLLAQQIAEQVEEIDLCRPDTQGTFVWEGRCGAHCGAGLRRTAAGADGRAAAAYWGEGARAISAAVYGGRAYEDALVELDDLLEDRDSA